MLFVVGLGAGVHVVVAHDIAFNQAAHADGADGRDRHRARTIVLGGDGFHGGEDVQALFGVGLAFFVAHGPHEDAGMIAIAADEVGELVQAFGVGRHHARLVEDQHAELVAGVE